MEYKKIITSLPGVEPGIFRCVTKCSRRRTPCHWATRNGNYLCRRSYLIMTYPIPSYRYKCYTLNLMVVIQVLYLKAYGWTQYCEAPQVPTKFLYSRDNLCYTP